MSNKINIERFSNVWWVCLWPGLAKLWYRGDFSGWVTAAGFTLLLNQALLSTFLWTRWPGEGFPWIIWPIVGVVWIGSAIVTYLQFERIVQLKSDALNRDDTLLIQAQTEYLKGNWSEVQAVVLRRLKQQPRDIPARLLLATLFRHTGSREKAEQQLEILERFDESAAWRFEIERERELTRQMAVDVDPTESPILTSDLEDQHANNLEQNLVQATVDLIDGDLQERANRKAA